MNTDKLTRVTHAKPILMAQMSEENLLARVLELDPAALGEAHDRYLPQIYRYAYLRTGDVQLAEDIAGEVFVRLLTALHGGRPPQATLRGWLYGVAAHLVVNHYSRKKMVALSETQPSGFSTQGSAEEKLRQAEVQAATAKLTPEQQEVLALRFGGGFSVEETAELMNRTITAVKALQFRAIDALRHLLAEVENE